MAEGGGLLNRYTLQRRIEGSNPSVSARASNQFQNRFRPRDSQLSFAGPLSVRRSLETSRAITT